MNGINDDQLSQLAQTLQKTKLHLVATIDAPNEFDTDYLRVSGEVHDSGDESIADLLSDLRIDSKHRAISTLTDVEEALLRIEDGSYGCCIDCGREINISRLQAYPMAKRCVDCKEIYERSSSKRQPASI